MDSPQHDTDAKAAMLETTRLALCLDWDDLRLVAAYMTVHELPRGKVLFKEGEPGAFMAVILSGDLEVTKLGPGEKSVRIGAIHARELAGEQAVIDGQVRSATVRAETPVQFMLLRLEAFETIMSRNPALGGKLMTALAREVSAKLRKTTGLLARAGCEEEGDGA
jgi:CRP-like cAMP-binding protein